MGLKENWASGFKSQLPIWSNAMGKVDTDAAGKAFAAAVPRIDEDTGIAFVKKAFGEAAATDIEKIKDKITDAKKDKYLRNLVAGVKDYAK